MGVHCVASNGCIVGVYWECEGVHIVGAYCAYSGCMVGARVCIFLGRPSPSADQPLDWANTGGGGSSASGYKWYFSQCTQYWQWYS